MLQELQGIEDPCWMKERRLEEQGAISTTPLMASVVAAMQAELGLRHLLRSVRPILKDGQICSCALAPRAGDGELFPLDS